jgi:hypothetical protein
LHTEFETEIVKGKNYLGLFYYRWEGPFLDPEDIKILSLEAIWDFGKRNRAVMS